MNGKRSLTRRDFTQTSGVAAGLAVKGGISPRKVDPAELQAALRYHAVGLDRGGDPQEYLQEGASVGIASRDGQVLGMGAP